MGMSFKYDGKEYEINVEKIEKLVETLIPRQIRARTKSGYDADGNPFEDYSDSYKEVVNRVEGNVKVDLERDKSNGMLASIKLVETTQTGNELNFTFRVATEHQRKAEEHHEGIGRLPKRRFLALSPKNEKALKAALMKLKIFEK